jgi:predicted nucleic acid-binding protein
MAAATPRKPLWVAVDTNVLLDLADGRESVWRAIETIRQRLPGVQIVVPPTAVQELAGIAEHGNPDERPLALTAARKLLGEWGFVPLNLIPVGHGITERIAAEIRARDFLPDDEVNDSFIVAESALAGCKILLSSDQHILDISVARLGILLAVGGLETLLISSPSDVARKFGR